MKNQFFGDKRDYFKYALIDELMKRVTGLRQLTCVWMLTPAIAQSHGSRRFVPHQGYESLAAFLTDRRTLGLLDVRELRHYFGGRTFTFNSYGDDPLDPFGTERDSYFASIPGTYLESALTLLDPDNGMEPKGGSRPAHLRYAELEAVFRRSRGPSALIVYQHLPRTPAVRFWPEVAKRLEQTVAARVLYVAEGDVALYVIPKPPASEEEVAATLRDYSLSRTVDGRHVQRVIGNT